MELKQLCQTLNIARDSDWRTAKYIANSAFCEGSKVEASVVYSALKGTQVISIGDRQAITEGIRNAKNIGEWKRIPVTMGMIDWLEPPDERTYTEKTADYQASLQRQFVNATSGHTKTRDQLNREERARRAYAGYGL